MDNKDKPNNNAGKGDNPRNIFSNTFKKNYEGINWGKSNTRKKSVKGSTKTTYKY